MLPQEALPLFAFGCENAQCASQSDAPSAKSPALTFKMTLDNSGEIINTEIFPSFINAKRITHEEADQLIDTRKDISLNELMELADRSLKRRLNNGAVNIEMPDVRITFNNGEVAVESINTYRSAALVRECMLIAGEGAGNWASQRIIAFPYISQEMEVAEKVPDGLAGFYYLRRCMRPRTLMTKRGRHSGLGLETYTQVTSPLRRYTDLLSHIQIRSFLAGKPLSSDEISQRLGAGEAAATAAAQAERASRNHWIMYYLGDKKDSKWEAIVLEKKGNRWAVIIPALALETQVSIQKNVSLNDTVELTLKSVNIPKGEAVFTC
jgi:exoribonuclease-2